MSLKQLAQKSHSPINKNFVSLATSQLFVLDFIIEQIKKALGLTKPKTEEIKIEWKTSKKNLKKKKSFEDK